MSDEAAREALTLCPECGPRVAVDEDGCCVSCGAVAMGRGVDTVFAKLAKAGAEIQAVKRELLSSQRTPQIEALVAKTWQDALDAVEKVMGWEEPSYAWWLALRLRHPRPSAQERAP